MKKSVKKLASTLVILCVFIIVTAALTCAEAKEKTTKIIGNVYEFGEKEHYNFSSSESLGATAEENTIGEFLLSGSLNEDGGKNGVPAYSVEAGTAVRFSYTYDDSIKKAADDQWHLDEDKSKTVDGIMLEDNIAKGAVILQVSVDGKKWISFSEEENIFDENETQRGSFYETSEIELLNGCYYRVIVVYKVSRQVESSKILFVKKKNYEHKKIAEVYEFYLYDKDNCVGSSLDNTEKVKLGKRIRTEDKGYIGQKDIDKDDPHYGWELGEFFVSGFTSKNVIDGRQYVLKNVGDVVTLGFYLKQDIDVLNGKDTLSISRDKDGYDRSYEISPTDFGRGTLIIQQTDPDGVTGEPQIYTNYLEANLSPKANTAVKLCEEGDYTVALDYEIQNDNKVVFGKSVLPEKTHYRIAFEFSVRNSNCMVYTFDSGTGSELKNGNVTDNGFYIDIANSQYLEVSVKKEILEDGADGLTEDTRFNRKAKDQEVYAEEGIYTISVKNKAAELESEKKIYVGTNKILKAYMVTGLSITEIQEKVAQGAVIEDDGTIIELSGKEIIDQPGEEEIKNVSVENISEDIEAEDVSVEDAAESQVSGKAFDFGVIGIAVIFVLIILIFIVRKKKRIHKTNIFAEHVPITENNESGESDADIEEEGHK